ncbi:MAG: efflux RND transporter periplasmic adaptor subunit [Planctomycetota bacterium]
MARNVVIVLMLAGTALGWLYWRQAHAGSSVVTGFLEADQVRAGSRVGGRVANVLVDEGTRVRAGQELYTLDPFDWQERLAQAVGQVAAYTAEHTRLASGYRAEEIAQARAKRDQAAATLDKLRAGPREREIRIAREKLKIAEANLELAQSEYERVERLRAEASAAKTEYDQAVRALKQTRAEVAAAQEELALLEEGTRAEDVAAAQSVLAEAAAALNLLESGFRAEDIAKAAAQVQSSQAQEDAIRAQMKELTVTSPCDCVVEAIDLRPGDLVAANAPTVTLLETPRIWLRTYVPQTYLGVLRLDDVVDIRVDSLPERAFRGRVSYIAGEGEFTPRNIQTPDERSKQVFRMKITFEGDVSDLRVGMSADVHLPRRREP